MSGIYYAQARYYDAGMGRFGAEDIIRSKSADVFEQRILDIDLADKNPVINVSQICTVDDLISQNYYAYANSSPISHIDLCGHFAFTPRRAGLEWFLRKNLKQLTRGFYMALSQAGGSNHE